MGMVSSIPYVLYTICIATSGVIADKIREACHFPTVWVRRAAMIIGTFFFVFFDHLTLLTFTAKTFFDFILIS